MERITGLEEIFINMRIDFARKFLLLPDIIDLYFDDCPSRRFLSIVNAAESDDHTIYLNNQWYHMSIAEHPLDVSFFIFHELRHMHQIMSIKRLQRGQTVQDPESDILQWDYDHNHYVRNVDAETQELNLQQTIEKDANAYGICLVNLFYAGNKEVDWRLSLPENAHIIANELSKSYYQSKPELKQFIDNIKRKTASLNNQSKTNHPHKKKKHKNKR